MFVHTCTACAKHQLIFESQVTAVAGSPEGVVLSFVCWCGRPQSHVLADTAPRRTPVAAA